jgi:hypothetical protein
MKEETESWQLKYSSEFLKPHFQRHEDIPAPSPMPQHSRITNPIPAGKKFLTRTFTPATLFLEGGAIDSSPR